MHRYLAVLTLGAFALGVARADIPPPKGLKRIPIQHKITTEKDYPEYLFFVVVADTTATARKLDAKTPASFDGGPRSLKFFAVPKDAAKDYANEKDFLAAVANGKVKGLVKAIQGFDPFREVQDTETQKVFVQEYKIAKIDSKAGIVLESVAPPKDTDNPPKKNSYGEPTDVGRGRPHDARRDRAEVTRTRPT